MSVNSYIGTQIIVIFPQPLVNTVFSFNLEYAAFDAWAIILPSVHGTNTSLFPLL